MPQADLKLGSRIACDPTDSTLYVVYTNFRSDGLRAVMFMRSPDGGSTWSFPVRLAPDSTQDARPIVTPDGTLHVIWVDYHAKQIVGRNSADRGMTFGPEYVVAPYLPNDNTLPPGLLRKGPFHDPTSPYAESFTNIPAIAVDASNGPHRRRLYVVWTERPTGVGDPATGEEISKVEPNETPATANRIEIGQTLFGGIPSVDLFLPDRRDWWVFHGQAGQTIQFSGTTRDIPFQYDHVREGHWQVLAATDTAHFGRIAYINTIDGTQPLPPGLVTLPYTGDYYLLGPGPGRYAVGYNLTLRNFRIDPASVARDHRDVVMTWSDDGGQSWHPRIRVNDEPWLFDDILPQVAVDDRGRVHVSWIDYRSDAVLESRYDLYWRMSDDGGLSFLPSQRISDFSSHWFDNYADPGTHTALATHGDDVFFAWPDTRDMEAGPIWTGQEIYLAKVHVDAPTPTLVSRFTAEPEAGGVRVTWRFEPGAGVVRVTPERAAVESESWSALPGAVIADGSGETSVLDEGAQPGVTYLYRLALELRDGSRTVEDQIQVTMPVRVQAITIAEARPNPFVEGVTLTLESPVAGHGRVAVYDVQGHEVVVLHDGELLPGRTALHWDGRAKSGAPVAPGVYLVRAEVAGRTASARLVRVN